MATLATPANTKRGETFGNTKRWIVWLGVGESRKIWKKLSTYEDEKVAKRVYDAFRKDGVIVRITEED